MITVIICSGFGVQENKICNCFHILSFYLPWIDRTRLPCLFNSYAEYIMQNAGLDEAQAGIKIAGRKINNLRYADDTILMAESKELKSLLMKVKAAAAKSH